MNIVGVTGLSGTGKDIIAARLVEKHGYVQLSLADPLKRFGLNVFGFDVIQLWGSAKNAPDPLYHECNIRSSGVQFSPDCKILNVKKVCDPHWAQAAIRLASFGPRWIEGLVPEKEREQALEDLFYWFASLGHHYPEISPRIMLQHLGTEWGRQMVSEDIWVNKMVDTADHMFRGFSYERETGLSPRKNKGPATGVVVSDIRFENEIVLLRKLGGTLVKVTRDASDRTAGKVGIHKHSSEVEQQGFADAVFDCILQNNGTIGELNKAVDIAAVTFKSCK